MVYLRKILQEVERGHEDEIGDDYEELLAMAMVRRLGNCVGLFLN